MYLSNLIIRYEEKYVKEIIRGMSMEYYVVGGNIVFDREEAIEANKEYDECE